MSHPITTQDELDIISLYARGYSQREICKELAHGGSQVSRTLKQRNIAILASEAQSFNSLYSEVNDFLCRQARTLRVICLLSILTAIISILI